MIFQSIIITVPYHNKFPKYVCYVIELRTTYKGKVIFKNSPEFPFNASGKVIFWLLLIIGLLFT